MARAKAAAASLLIALLVVLGAAPAWAQFGTRYALVIGNSNYANVERLPNTSRDAEAIAEALEALMFTVFKGIDLTGDQFESLLEEFEAASAEADTVVFYYAGHGFQLNGLNHLVPVDAVLRDRSRIDEETLVLNDIIERIHRQRRQTIVFLDACRNNPLPPSAQDGASAGLAQVGTGDGTFIAFATQPGNVSYDGTGRNSPFTEALLTHIGSPGRSISSLMIEVRNDVSDRTVGKQVPWDQSSLRADFIFNPTTAYVAMNEPAQGGIVLGRPGPSAIRGQVDPGADDLLIEPPVETALTAPAVPDITIGRAPVEALDVSPSAPLPATEARRPAPMQAIEAQRQAALPATGAQRQQAAGVQRPATLPATGAQRQPASGTALPAAAARSQALKPDREWFPDDMASEAPAEPEQQMAALDPQQPLVPEPRQQPEEPLVDQRELARSIQSALSELGCYRLGIDGDWGPGSRAGLENFYREKGETPPSLEPSTDVLAALQGESGRVCAPPKKQHVEAPPKPKKERQAQKRPPAPRQQPAAAAPQRAPSPPSIPRILQ